MFLHVTQDLSLFFIVSVTYIIINVIFPFGQLQMQ
jgi:hypothetical protein